MPEEDDVLLSVAAAAAAAAATATSDARSVRVSRLAVAIRVPGPTCPV